MQGREGRRIVHSIYFRGPEEYAGKIILIVVVGAGASDADIVMQSSGHAKKVRVWSSSPSTGVADGNVVWVYRSLPPYGAQTAMGSFRDSLRT